MKNMKLRALCEGAVLLAAERSFAAYAAYGVPNEAKIFSSVTSEFTRIPHSKSSLLLFSFGISVAKSSRICSVYDI